MTIIQGSDFSFAHGNGAETDNSEGTAIWADSQNIVTRNTTPDSIIFRYRNGIVLASGTEIIDYSGNGVYVHISGDTMTGDLVMGNGSNILPEVSGIGNIGSITHPFDTIYANNVVSSISGTDNGPFVHLSGDTMTGELIAPVLTAGSRTGTVGFNSIAVGSNVSAAQFASAAFGSNSVATGFASLAEANGTASGFASHAEGQSTASDSYTHAEGFLTQARAFVAHSEGYNTLANSAYSHAEGFSNKSLSNSSHSEGDTNVSAGFVTHSEGSFNIAGGNYSHAEGYNNNSIGDYSHVEGSGVKAVSTYSHAEGVDTLAGPTIYPFTLTSGTSTIAIVPGDITGPMTGATQLKFFLFGNLANQGDYTGLTQGIGSVTFDGTDTLIDFGPGQFGGSTSGYLSRTENLAAHSEGMSTIAFGQGSHSQGINTIASGTGSFVGGSGSIAGGDYSLAIGVGAKTSTLPGTAILTDSQNVSTTNNIQDSIWFRFAGGINTVSGTNILPVTSGTNRIGTASLPFQSINACVISGTSIFLNGVALINGGSSVSVSGTAPITVISGLIAMPSGNATTDGYITKGDWNIFNNKQTSGNYVVSGSSTILNILDATQLSGTTINNDTINGKTATFTTIVRSPVISGTTISGNTIVLNGTAIVNALANVNSVNGATGAVTLTTTNISEGTNLYYTDARARAIVSGTSPITVVNGLIALPSGNATNNGYITSGDWTTFNSKQSSGNYVVSGSSTILNVLNATVISGTTLSGNTATITTINNNTLNSSTGDFSTIVNSPSLSGTIITNDTLNGKFGTFTTMLTSNNISGTNISGTNLYQNVQTVNISTQPSGTLAMSAREIANRDMFRSMDKRGNSSPFQFAIFDRPIQLVQVSNGGTFFTWGNNTSQAGTVSTPYTSGYGFMANFATIQGGILAAGIQHGFVSAARGNQYGDGFFVSQTVGFPNAPTAYTSGTRVFLGLCDQLMNTMTQSDNPGGNYCGFAYSSIRPDTNFQFYTKDNSTQTVGNTGMPFTVNSVYKTYFYCPKADFASIFWRIENVTLGTSAEGVATATLPLSGTAMITTSCIGTRFSGVVTMKFQKSWQEGDV